MEIKKDKKDWNKFYQTSGLLDQSSYLSHKKYFTRYFSTIKKYTPSGGSVLEIACGPGKLLTVLSKTSNLKITATEIVPELLLVAEKNVGKFGNSKNVKFEVLDCFKLISDSRFEQSYDTIVHHGLVEHFENMDDVVKMINIQRKKAKFVIFGLPYFSKRNRNIWDKSDYKVYRSHWLYNEWKKFFLENFDVIEVFKFDSKADNLMCVIKGDK